MKLHLYDSNNIMRRRHEMDTTGLALRNSFTEAFHNPDPVIYVFDGKNAKAARRAVFPDYKANRIPAPDAFYTVLDMFKRLVLYTNKTYLEVPGYEADDVIAHLVRSSDVAPITIHSNDADFLALCGDRVTMTDVSAKFKDISREDTRLFKTLVGDPTDNIKGVFKFGTKGFMKLDPGQKACWEMVLSAQTLPPGVNAEALGLSPAQWTWTLTNFHLLVSYWQIINFIDIPSTLVTQHAVSGHPNMAAANALLKEVFQ